MNKYSETFTIRNFNTGPSGLADIPSLFHFMYEAAGEHCVESEITVHDLQRIGLTWMLSRMHAEFNRIPAYNDQLTVTTWPTGVRGLYSCRDFQVTDSSGDELIRATSAWLTINLEKRRVVRLPQKIVDIHPDVEDAERMIVDNFRGKLDEPEDATIVDGFRADYSTLDFNSHVTSAVYIRWLLDALPIDFQVEKKLKKFEIVHKLEILPGEEAQADYLINGNEVKHCIRPAGGGAANCIAHSIWE